MDWWASPKCLALKSIQESQSTIGILLMKGLCVDLFNPQINTEEAPYIQDYWKENKFSSKNTLCSKIITQNWRSFPDKQKLKDFIIIKLVL